MLGVRRAAWCMKKYTNVRLQQCVNETTALNLNTLTTCEELNIVVGEQQGTFTIALVCSR